jgi:predicted DNA-binding protein
MERKHYYLPPQLIARLKEFSEKQGVPPGEIVRQALDAYLKRNGG